MDLKLQINQQPDFSIEIMKLDFEKIDINKISNICKNMELTSDLNIWTVLYSMIIIVVLCIAYKYSRKTRPTSREVQRTPKVLFRDG